MKLRTIFFIFSVVLNIAVVIMYGLTVGNNPSEIPGVLTEDVQIGVPFAQDGKTIMTLPKGTVVSDFSPGNTIDLFEPHRFAIIVTSERDDLVDYSAEPKKGYGGMYSADSWRKQGQ